MIAETLGQHRPPGLVPGLRVCPGLQQTLRNLLGLVKATLVEETADEQEGRVTVVVRSVDDQVVLHVGAPGVKDKLDHLDDVRHLGALGEDRVEGGAAGGLRGLEPGQQGREPGLALTMDSGKDLVVVVPHRLRVLVIIEPVVQKLVGGHLDTAVV